MNTREKEILLKGIAIGLDLAQNVEQEIKQEPAEQVKGKYVKKTNRVYKQNKKFTGKKHNKDISKNGKVVYRPTEEYKEWLRTNTGVDEKQSRRMKDVWKKRKAREAEKKQADPYDGLAHLNQSLNDEDEQTTSN